MSQLEDCIFEYSYCQHLYIYATNTRNIQKILLAWLLLLIITLAPLPFSHWQGLNLLSCFFCLDFLLPVHLTHISSCHFQLPLAPTLVYIRWIYSTEIYLNLHGSIVPKSTWIYLDLPGSTWIYLDLSETTWIYQDLPGSTWIYLYLLGSAWISMYLSGSTWIYLNNPNLHSTWICLDLPNIPRSTWIYLALPRSIWIYLNQDLPDYLYLPESSWIFLNLPGSTYNIPRSV